MSRFAFHLPALLLALVLFTGMLTSHDHAVGDFGDDDHVCLACSAIDDVSSAASATMAIAFVPGTPQPFVWVSGPTLAFASHYQARAPPSVS